MTQEEQKVAIATACGWSHIENISTIRIGGTYVGYPSKNPILGERQKLPDYINDLNAMHEAEKALQDKCLFWPDYVDELSKMFRVGFPGKDATNWSQMCHATAAQRAEAFLKTIGKWEEDDQGEDVSRQHGLDEDSEREKDN